MGYSGKKLNLKITLHSNVEIFKKLIGLYNITNNMSRFYTMSYFLGTIFPLFVPFSKGLIYTTLPDL